MYSLAVLIVTLLSGCDAARDHSLPPTPTAMALMTAVNPPAATALPTTITPIPLPSPTFTATPLPVARPQPDLAASPSQTQLPPIGPAITPNQISPPATEALANDTLAGTWNFSFGTMELSQRNSVIEGRYRWFGGGDNGHIQGNFLAELRQIRGLWISDRDPTEQGFLGARLAGDGDEFIGTFDRRTLSVLWCAARSGGALPPGCGFSGDWQLRFSSPPNLAGQAVLTQTGDSVRGTFRGIDGRSGEIEGRVVVPSITEAQLSGTWRNDRGETDTFEWRLNLTTGRTFAGRRQPGNSEWCGWRSGTSAPDPCGW